MKKFTLLILFVISAYYLWDAQQSKSAPSDQNYKWGESAEHRTESNLLYKTYFTTLADNSTVRNFTVCYDTEKIVPQWVAYPLHPIYTTPKIDRTNAWAFDDAITDYGAGGYDILGYAPTQPIIPQHLQPNIIYGGFNDGENRALDRGHMVPSASRYSSWQTNAQTFYATNIFPQNARLNQRSWNDLEVGVRASMCADTLYVVVGTLFENSTIFHSRNRAITRPSHCYKLLLRTKSGNTGNHISQITDADSLIAIGFVFENSSNGDIPLSEAVVSIAEIERRSGHKFFVSINPTIEKAVKEQKNIADWPALR